MAARRRGDPVRQHDLPRRRRTTPRTGSASRNARRASTTRAPSTISRSATGTAGSTSGARRCMLQTLGDGAGTARPARGHRAREQSRASAATSTTTASMLDAAWSPDGSAIVFTATDRARPGRARRRPAVALRDARRAAASRGGSPATKAAIPQPRFAPDGSALYARQTPHTRFVYNDERLVRFDWASTSPRPVAFGFHRSVGDFAVTPDGERIYLLAEDAGHDRLYAVPAAGGEVREVGRLESRTSARGLQVDGGEDAPVIVANWDSAVSPPEVDAHRSGAGERQRAQRIQCRARRRDRLGSRCRNSGSSRSAAARIHNLVALPPGFDPAKKYPLFVLIHGGPHTMFKDQFFIRWNYHLLAAPGYVVADAELLRLDRLRRGVRAEDPGRSAEGPGRRDQPGGRRGDPRASRSSMRAARRAGGASYGGHLANWLAVSTDRYRALVSHAGLYRPQDANGRPATSPTRASATSAARRGRGSRCGATRVRSGTRRS